MFCFVLFCFFDLRITPFSTEEKTIEHRKGRLRSSCGLPEGGSKRTLGGGIEEEEEVEVLHGGAPPPCERFREGLGFPHAIASARQRQNKNSRDLV